MTRLRRDTQDSSASSSQRPFRVVACGTLFLTHTLSLPTHPEPSTVVRASSVTRSRGGPASTCLAILAQFPAVHAILVAPLGGNDDGKQIIRELETERVSTKYCKIWEEAGVPSAWVLHADDTDARTVINNNPLPDITHEDFISLLGPLIAPENYAYLSPTSQAAAGPTHPIGSIPHTVQPRKSLSNLHASVERSTVNTNTPAPFEWIHFEGRSVKTTLSNIMGLEGLARERKWRNHCTFSVDIGRRARQGVEALIPYADVVFLNKHYARAHSPQYASSPRAFLLSLTALVPPHALLVAYWGEEGAAVLSVPTREYFQSSGWVGLDSSNPIPEVSALSMRTGTDPGDHDPEDRVEMVSVRTESDFWAGQHTDSSSIFTAGAFSQSFSASPSPTLPRPPENVHATSAWTRETHRHRRSESSDSDGTQIGAHRTDQGRTQRVDNAALRGASIAAQHSHSAVIDEVGAQDAFIAGMILALGRRMLPGEPYTPMSGARNNADAGEGEKGRWRLEECLRFATELAGRKGRRKGWDGLADEMARAGWLEI